MTWFFDIYYESKRIQTQKCQVSLSIRLVRVAVVQISTSIDSDTITHLFDLKS